MAVSRVIRQIYILFYSATLAKVASFTLTKYFGRKESLLFKAVVTISERDKRGLKR